MSANFTHAINAHGCRISYTFDNRAARIEYPESSGKAPQEFTSEPIEYLKRKLEDGSTETLAVKGEPTATMQALHAAKAVFLESESAAQAAENEAVAAAVEKAKAKAAAASTPKPKGK